MSSSAVWLAEHLAEVPVLLFVFGKEGGESSTFPVLWNACLAARAEGVGTTITTLLRAHRTDVNDLLGVPDDGEWRMHAMVPMGYPTGRWGIAERRPAYARYVRETNAFFPGPRRPVDAMVEPR